MNQSNQTNFTSVCKTININEPETSKPISPAGCSPATSEKANKALPKTFNFATDVIDHWAQFDDKPAMIWVDDYGVEVRKTFRDISIASRKLCTVLKEAGIKRADTVVVILRHQIAWWEAITACLRMGVIVSPGSMLLGPADLASRINALEARCIITDTVGAAKMEPVMDQCSSLCCKLIVGGDKDGWIDYHSAVANATADNASIQTASDENALCYFTSGTTGYPKMVMHTHGYALALQNTGKYWLNLTEKDIHWNICSTGWAKAAWSSYFGPWICGATIFVHHSPVFNPTQALSLLSRYPVSSVCATPTVYRMLVQQELNDYKFPALRHCVAAGEPLNPQVIKVWKRATGLTIRDGYGQTETTILCGNFLSIEPRLGSMGKPAPGIDLHIIDQYGEIAPVNTEGDIAVRVKPHRPQGLFKEYKNQPELTRRCFKGDWYLTGDRAYVDKDGYFWFVSRSDDVITVGGYSTGPFDIESVLLEHPAVVESAVVSSPDEDGEAVVKAFIVLAPHYQQGQALAQALQSHVEAIMSPHQCPQKIEFVKSLPKTISGKIRRVRLREKEWKAYENNQ